MIWRAPLTSFLKPAATSLPGVALSPAPKKLRSGMRDRQYWLGRHARINGTVDLFVGVALDRDGVHALPAHSANAGDLHFLCAQR